MFDIGFLELALIGVVALLVIGPERLPLVARKVGMWAGKARRFISHVQSDLKQEIDKTEQLKRLLEEQSKLKATHEILEQTVDESGRVPATSHLPHKTKPFSEPSGDSESNATNHPKPADNAASSSVKVNEDHEQNK